MPTTLGIMTQENGNNKKINLYINYLEKNYRNLQKWM